ncbi:unnamed protein product [Dicrocoelium dendriticum]|nr:unnamed protein product [Dicrocoelium dendriticum]
MHTRAPNMSSTGTTVSTEDVHKLEGTSPSYEPQDMPPRHFWPHVMTDFHSVTSVEPMEQCTVQQSPLEMTCEAHGPNEVHSSVTTPENMALSSRKKTSFADHAEVVNISKDEGLDAQAFVEFMDDTEDINNHLLEQFENISVSTHSETSAEIDELNQDAEVQSNARLDQITTRIFATVLPDDETPQQRHCDLVQAQRRLYELTSGAEVLLINCGESNAQLMTVFKLVQNCPFNLDAPPDLATYVAFAERVHDWLLVASSRAVLLHAEGTTARTRLLLLIRALSSYYEAKDRHDPNSSRLLRQYVVSYPNGIISSPIGWLRFAGYLGLFSPDSCLSILRANLCIYTLCLHNFPVFEENKLRLFVKFYTGSPLRHAYTTAIHDFYHSDSNNLALAFSHCLDAATTPPCLIIQGNITVIAYHCRPYPHKRLRLFRLHFHSCEGCFEPLTFHRDDFDELCDAFPSTVLLELLCTNRPLTTHATVQVTNVDWQFAKGSGIPSGSAASLNQLSCAMSSDEAVRRHDSLEHLTDLARNSQSVRKVLFRSINEHTNPKSHPNAVGIPLHLSKSLTDGQDGVYDHTVLSKVRLKATTEKPTASINKRSFLDVFSRQPAGSMEKRDEKGVQVSGNIEPRTLMPPPMETQVPKIKRIIGKRLVKLFSKRGSKEYTFKTDNSSESSSGSESFSSEDSTGKRSDGWLSELLSSSSRKARASFRGLSSPRSSPPRKTRKMDNAVDTNASTVAAVPFHLHSEDLLQAARRLNFMAGTQELDRLLEELRLTSMQMAAGLPPPKATTYAHTYTPRYSTIHSTSTHSQNRLHTTRSSSSAAMGQVGGQNEHTYGSSSPNVHPSSYTYQRQSSYHTEGRLDGLNKPSHYTTPRSHYYPSSGSRHQTTYTTVLKQRPPIGPRQLSQVHLTIDPECGSNELPHTTTHSSERDVNLREQRLENELNLARRELAQLRRAMSLVEERRRHEFNEETRSSLSPAYLPMARSPASVQQQFLSTSSSYQSHHLGTRSTSSTFQRSSPRQEGPYGVGTSVGTYGVPKRAMSQTNMQTTRSWNLRSQHQGSETDLAFKRVTSVSQPPGRSGYSAHRERLRQEREQELLMRQHRQRQLAASTTGLNEQHLHRHQQQYRSLSAVNTTGGTDAFEEVETIILQPIGRGVQDIDSRTGSMTTLHRGPTGSMVEERKTPQSRSYLLGKNAIYRYLNRNTSNTDLSRPLAVHQSHATIVPATTMQSLQNSRYDTTPTLVNNTQTAQFSGSRSHLTNTSSSTLAPAQATTVPNGWKTETTKRTYIDGTETNPLSLVQETAPLWYRPHLSRDAAISILRQQPPGSFLIRDSTTFKGAFGLAVKVATLPPKVTPKSDDLQAELVRHYLIEVINTAPRGVRLKGFASEPVFPSLAALIHEHTIDQLALPCKLILPPGPTNLPSSGTGALPHLVVGTIVNSDALMVDNATVTSAGSLLGPTASDSGSVQMDSTQQMEDGNTVPINATEAPATSTHNVPLVCVLRESAAHQRRSPMEMNAGQGLTFRCLMLGSVDSAQWGKDLCFARAVDQLIPLTQLTAAECDHGVSRVRYTEVQLRVSAHDGITIIDLLRRLFLRRHLPNHVLLFCGLETRKKEFLHPEHQAQGIVNPKIFGIVVRKGITEYTTHVFSECDPAHPAESIVQHIRTTYPHLMSR